MKKRSSKIIFCVIALFMSAVLIFLTSCDSMNDKKEGSESETDKKTEAVASDSLDASKEENSGGVINNITIESSESTVAHASAKALRSAVSIYCIFEKVTGGNSPWNPIPTTQQYYSMGSGVIYKLEKDGSAFIITNFHVVYSSDSTDGAVSDQIYLYLYGLENEAYAIPATYVGGSPNYDIAVLRVDKNEILKEAYENGTAVAVEVANSDEIVPGEATVAVGNPSDSEIDGISVTRGIVSVDSEYVQMSAFDGSGTVSFRVIRTDTPVNPGNSGGGLYNDNGELVGIVSAKSALTDADSIGYAIPSNVARAITDNVIYNCYGKDCDTLMKGLFGGKVGATRLYTVYDTERGIILKKETVAISEITSGGFCEDILQENDVIKSITIGGKTKEIYRQYQVNDAMFEFRVGEEVSMLIERDGEEMTVKKVITEEHVAAY